MSDRPHIHFWTPDDADTRDVDRWDPDREPTRYASGLGHNVYELFVRMFRAGDAVSLGPVAPTRADLVVVFLKALAARLTFRSALRAVHRARARVAVIRSDSDPGAEFPVRPLVEYVGAPSQVESHWQEWLPPPPQRGLLRRRDDRRGRVRRVAFKGNPENVPDFLEDPAWRAEFAARGLELWIDAPSRTDGSDQRWHDFTDVDAVLCVRSEDRAATLAAVKPPTRLINAWLAGSVPICSRETAYLDLAGDGEDALFVEGPSDVLAQVERLANDPGVVRSLESRMARRAASFTPERTLERWRCSLRDAAGRDPGRTRRAKTAYRRLRSELAVAAERSHLLSG